MKAINQIFNSLLFNFSNPDTFQSPPGVTTETNSHQPPHRAFLEDADGLWNLPRRGLELDVADEVKVKGIRQLPLDLRDVQFSRDRVYRLNSHTHHGYQPR